MGPSTSRHSPGRRARGETVGGRAGDRDTVLIFVRTCTIPQICSKIFFWGEGLFCKVPYPVVNVIFTRFLLS